MTLCLLWLLHHTWHQNTVLHTVDFLFIGWHDGGEASSEAGFPRFIGKEVGAEAGAALHDLFLAGFRIEVRVLDDFSRMVFLHHARLVVEGCGGILDAVAPFVARHVVSDVDAA